MKRLKPIWAQLAAPTFNTCLNETLCETPTVRLLRALRRVTINHRGWSDWRIRQLSLVRREGSLGIQFQATGCIAQPWVQLYYDSDTDQGVCCVGRLHRLQFQGLSEAPFFALTQLPRVCVTWAQCTYLVDEEDAQ